MGFAEFQEAAHEAKKIAFSFSSPLIVHHYDADGLSSGAIVKSAFLGRPHRMWGIKKLDDAAMEKLMNEREIIFVDLGNNERVRELKDVLIIDHHQVKETGKPQINPMMHGIDGGSELSSSGTAYFVFGKNADLGLVGALGDMQYPLTGANKTMCEQGIASGEIRKEIDLRFYGRFSRPLAQFLAYSEEPPVPGIAYSEERAQKLLEDLGIEPRKGEEWRVYADLDLDEKRKLISAIAELISRKRRVEGLVGEVYDLPKRPRRSALYDAHEFSTVLNACGRHGKPELGIAVCLGDEAAYLEASSFLALHKRMIREGVLFARASMSDLGPFLFLDARGIIDEGIIGVVCGMVLQGAQKPIIGIAHGEGDIKVSSRTGRRTGINLGNVMNVAAGKVGGIGGGHSVAAGASVPTDKVNEFLIEAKVVIEMEMAIRQKAKD
ncbi:MAG: DHH family phosphoesterase [Candidatus ainarchaeum sp.]|nr:DHH family phosphoesterase [Candidatus ainarchaeum sp.]